MAKDHARAGIAHDLDDFLTHFFFITVDRAISANRFVFSEFTLIQTLMGVVKKLLTILAEFVLGLMFILAMELNQNGNRIFFSLDSWGWLHGGSLRSCLR